MCRIVAYIGPPLRLSALLGDAPHGLMDQSRNAGRMTGSSVAGDGWGVGWFCPEAGAEPGLLKSILPLWSDENGKLATRAIASGSIVGHVRYAAEGVETCFLNTPIYALDGRLWTVNGAIEPWPGPISSALRARLDADHEADLRGSTDAEMLGALWRTHLRRIGGRDVAGALRSTLREAREIAHRHRGKIRMNVIIAEAASGVAARFSDEGEPNTLVYSEGESRWNGGAMVASEPLDDGAGWIDVGPDSLLHYDAEGVRVEPLHLDKEVEVLAH
jgi:glutamine amidotransferase